MKKVLLAFILILMLVLCTGTSYASQDEPIYRHILLPNTPLYLEPNSNSQQLALMPQNAEVIFVDELENSQFAKIKFQGIDGFCKKDLLYQSTKSAVYKIKGCRALAQKLGEDIPLYRYPSTTSEILNTIPDGTKLQMVDDSTIAHGFTKIVYDNSFAYIVSDNTTHFLSLNQKYAIIIGAITIMVVLSLLFLNRIKSQKKNQHQNN